MSYFTIVFHRRLVTQTTVLLSRFEVLLRSHFDAVPPAHWAKMKVHANPKHDTTPLTSREGRGP